MMLDLIHSMVGNPTMFLTDPWQIYWMLTVEYICGFILMMYVLKFIMQLFKIPHKLLKP